MNAGGSRRGSLALRENDTPGCMQSLLHFLDLHQRLRLRKTLAYRRHSSEKNKSPKRKRNSASDVEDQTDLEKDANSITKNKDSSGSRSSPNAIVKGLMSRKRCRDKEKRHIAPLLASQMQRTMSIHHLESNDYVPTDELTSPNENSTTVLDPGGTHPSHSKEAVSILPRTTESPTTPKHYRFSRSKSSIDGASHVRKKLNEAKESLSKRTASDAKELERDAAIYESKEFKDMMQLYSENRELFLKFLQDPTFIFTYHAQNQKVSSPAKGLTKSGSFPGAGWSHINRLLSLHHIQNENKSRGKKEKNLQDEESSSFCNIIEEGAHPVELMDHEDVNMRKAEEGTTYSSELGFAESKKPKNVGTVSRRFRVLKQKIKDIIKENKKEHQRISMDSILHKIPYGEKISENVKKKSEGLWQGRHDKYISKGKFGKNGLASSSSKHALKSIRKTSSLTESLGRYSQLLESVSRVESVPISESVSRVEPVSREESISRIESKRYLDMSKSIKEDPSRRTTPKGLERMFSLPELNSFILNKDLKSVVSNSQLAIRPTSGVVAGSTAADACDPRQLDPVAALTCNEESMEPEKLVECSMKEDVSGTPVRTEGQPVSIGEQEEFEAHKDQSLFTIEENSCCSPDGYRRDIPMIPSDILVAPETDTITKDSELKKIQSHEPDLMSIQQIDSGIDNPLMLENVEQPLDEILTSGELSNFKSFRIQLSERDEAEFQYVRSILLKSGFSSEDALGEWYLPDQPVDPSLFEEAECSSHDLEIAGDNPNTTVKHMLLFDLINEVLLEIYDTSFAYCPWVLHADCQIRPVSVGHRVLEEVWAVISKHLSNQLQLDQTVESTVARDFTKNDGWMNLQHDIEFLGLELEDWILDDLIDEIVYDFDELLSSQHV